MFPACIISIGFRFGFHFRNSVRELIVDLHWIDSFPPHSFCFWETSHQPILANYISWAVPWHCESTLTDWEPDMSLWMGCPKTAVGWPLFIQGIWSQESRMHSMALHLFSLLIPLSIQPFRLGQGKGRLSHSVSCPGRWDEIRSPLVRKKSGQEHPEQLETEQIMPSCGWREKSQPKLRGSLLKAAHKEWEIHNRANLLGLVWAMSLVAWC